MNRISSNVCSTDLSNYPPIQMNRTHVCMCMLRSLSGRRRAVVSKPRFDMCSREALRYPELKDRIELNKIRDHFICLYSILHIFNR